MRRRFEENFDDIEDEDEIDNEYEIDKIKKSIELFSNILEIDKKEFIERKKFDAIKNILMKDIILSLSDITLDKEVEIKNNLQKLGNRIIEQYQYNQKKDKVIIGLGGKFSSGKSKFINSLLNTNDIILPENQNPTTSISTYITYGDVNEIIAYTTNDSKIKLDENQFKLLTHRFLDNLNPELRNVKVNFSSFINSLFVKLPIFPYKNIILVDTPGYSKDDSGNINRLDYLTDEIKAYNQLVSVDTVIWLMDIENGIINDSDIDFLLKLKLKNPILIVINKADKKIDKDIEDILDSTKKVLKNTQLNIFAVTAYSSRDKKEWKNNYIEQFLNSIVKTKEIEKDIVTQIYDIEDFILNEINNKLEKKEIERNRLNDIIFNSVNIMEDNGVIILYSEVLNEIRNIKKCKKNFLKQKEKLNDLLKNLIR